jgi:hypothetical protein
MPHANLLNRRIQEDDEMMSGAPQPQRQPHTHTRRRNGKIITPARRIEIRCPRKRAIENDSNMTNDELTRE